MQNQFIDWTEDFDGVGRELKSSNSYSYTSTSRRCYNFDGEEVDCRTGEVKEDAPAWLVAVIIVVIALIVAIILVCVATKKCKKKWKCARIIKCCKRNATAEAECCGQKIHSSDSDK